MRSALAFVVLLDALLEVVGATDIKRLVGAFKDINKMLHRARFTLAAGLGLEPRYQLPESCVLPLDDPAILSTMLFMQIFFYHNHGRQRADSHSEP